MTKELKKEKGITLVALIITIIVLIILVAISIKAIVDFNIVKLAQNSSAEYEGKQQEEKKQMKNIENLLTKAIANIEAGGNGGDNPKPPVPPVEEDKSGANEPGLTKIAQKTYVTWSLNETSGEYEINDDQETKPTDWYNYEKGKWANIKTKNAGLEAYWVWVPRYEYKVPTSETACEIEVKFIPTSKQEPDAGYTIHPAFTNAGNGGLGELDGIWCAKFEANSSSPTNSYGGGNDATLKVQSKPLEQSWRNIETKNIFAVCRKMTGEGEVLAGSTVDSHMMKNTEWGAVAILSQSKYGIYNPESSTGANGDQTYQVWNNPNGYNSNQNIYTGYAGNEKDASNSSSASSSPAGAVAYNKIAGTKASTTGTVYGIYDMAGGSWEYVAGCLNGQEYSKFGVTAGESKYVDLYTNSDDSSSNYEGAITGDATKETKRWNGDTAIFVYSGLLVFRRGR